jgi:hypothetical protein
MLHTSQRHEERKTQLKAHEEQRFWCHIEHNSLRQEKRRDTHARSMVGSNIDNVSAFASRVRLTDDVPDFSEEDGDLEAEAEELLGATMIEAPRSTTTTSGATLLAMARPAKTRRLPLPITDGEAFEVVEIDGCLVALDEDGWEILPGEHDEASLLYSDIVRGTVLDDG